MSGTLARMVGRTDGAGCWCILCRNPHPKGCTRRHERRRLKRRERQRFRHEARAASDERETD